MDILIFVLLAFWALIAVIYYLASAASPLKIWQIKRAHFEGHVLLTWRWRFLRDCPHRYHTYDILYFMKYDTFTKQFTAGCFRGHYSAAIYRLSRRSRHKLAKQFYQQELLRLIDANNLSVEA